MASILFLAEIYAITSVIRRNYCTEEKKYFHMVFSYTQDERWLDA